MDDHNPSVGIANALKPYMSTASKAGHWYRDSYPNQAKSRVHPSQPQRPHQWR